MAIEGNGQLSAFEEKFQIAAIKTYEFLKDFKVLAKKPMSYTLFKITYNPSYFDWPQL